MQELANLEQEADKKMVEIYKSSQGVNTYTVKTNDLARLEELLSIALAKIVNTK